MSLSLIFRLDEKSPSLAVSFVVGFVMVIGIADFMLMSSLPITADVLVEFMAISNPCFSNVLNFAKPAIFLSINFSIWLCSEFGPSEEFKGGMLLTPKNPSEISSLDAAVL